MSLIVMGWKGHTTKRDRIFGEVTDMVVRHAPCDLITIKLMGDTPVKTILIPTAGGPHANLTADYVAILNAALDATVTCCYVVKREATPTERETAEEWMAKTVQKSGLERCAQKMVIEGDNIAVSLGKASSEYDLIVLGASKEGIFSSVLFGEIPEKVARFSRTPVMIVRRYEGQVKSLIRRIMG